MSEVSASIGLVSLVTITCIYGPRYALHSKYADRRRELGSQAYLAFANLHASRVANTFVKY